MINRMYSPLIYGILLSSLLSSLIVGSPSWAQPPRLGEGRLQERVTQGSRPGEWLDELDLTTGQLRQIRAIHQTHEAELQARKTALRSSRQRLRDLMSGDASAEVVRAQRDETMSLEDEVRDLRFEVLLEIREVLDPSQREQLARVMEDRLGR